MRVRWTLAVVAVLLVVGQLGYRRLRRPEPSPRAARLYAELARHRAVNEHLAPAMTDVLRAVDPRLDVRVNQPYDGKSTHVYLVNLDALPAPLALRELGFTTDASLQDVLARNLVAVPPNAILIDDSFLAFLIIDAASDTVAMMQLVNTMDAALQRAKGDGAAAQRDPEVVAMTTRLRVAALYQQLVNLESFDDRDGRDTIRAAAHEYATLVADSHARRELTLHLSAALMPVLSHELGHLRDGTAGQFEVGAIASATLNRREEQHADEIARKYVQERVRAANARMKAGETAAGFDLQPLIWFGRLLAEMALVEMFRDFRGLTPLQVLVDVEQHECGSDGIYPVNARGFAGGSYNEIPILTEEEWRRMRERVAAWPRQSHAPLIARSVYYLEPLQGRVDERAIGSQLDFFNALSANDPAAIFTRPAQTPLDADAETLLARLRPLLTFERAAAFEGNHTLIARFPRGGWVEVRSAGTKLESVRFVMVTEGSRQLSQTMVDRYAALFLAVTMASGAPASAVESGIKALFRSDRPECHSQTRSVVIGRAGLVYHGILDTGSYIVEIVHPSRIRGPRVD